MKRRQRLTRAGLDVLRRCSPGQVAALLAIAHGFRKNRSDRGVPPLASLLTPEQARAYHASEPPHAQPAEGRS